jgi:hypothetical protein
MTSPLDPRDIFVAGATWWAGPFDGVAPGAYDVAERYFPDGRMDHPDGRYVTEGSWPPFYVGRAFVQGAKWQKFAATNGTMWPADVDIAEKEALRRYPMEGEPYPPKSCPHCGVEAVWIEKLTSWICDRPPGCGSCIPNVHRVALTADLAEGQRLILESLGPR